MMFLSINSRVLLPSTVHRIQVDAVSPSTMPKHSSRTVRPREMRARKIPSDSINHPPCPVEHGPALREAAFSDGIGIEQHARQIHQQHPHRIGEVVHDEAGTADNEHPTASGSSGNYARHWRYVNSFCRPQATQMALRIIQQVMMIASSCRVCGMPNNHCIHSVTSGVARPRLVPIAKIKATR